MTFGRHFLTRGESLHKHKQVLKGQGRFWQLQYFSAQVIFVAFTLICSLFYLRAASQRNADAPCLL